ncbi:hypothetical protein ITP31_004002 [Salmonella enterica]|nr:hypothetical protein [Salmonella enterica]
MSFNDKEKQTPAQDMKDFKNQKREERRTESRNDDREEDRGGRRNRRDDASDKKPGNDPWGMMTKFGAPISSINGSALEKFSTPAKDFLEFYGATFADKFGLKLDILLAGTEQTRVRIESVIFLATREKAGAKPETLVYTLFLPTSSNIGTQYTEGERGRSGLGYSAVASDAYDGHFKRNVEAFIKKDSRNNAGDIIHIGAGTVPSTFDLNKEEKVRGLIQYAVNVLWYQFADMYDNINDFALVDLFPKRNGDDEDDRRGRRRDDEVILNSNVVFKPEESLDVFEMPHEHDIQIEVSLGRRRRDKDRPRNALSLEENQTLAKIGANVDLVYLGEEDNGGRRSGRNKFRGRRRDEESAVPLYGLALNVTEITTEGRDVMAMQLTALANIPLLIKESILTQALLPSADEVRLRDPRALALEQPESFPADLIAEHPSEEEWANLMEAVLHEDSTYIFLHAPRTGVHSQLLTYLVDACDEESDTSDDSYEIVTRVLNALTNNEYRQLGGEDMEFGTLEIRQSFAGYWNDDRSGERRDLAPIGYFNMLTRFGQQHPEYLDIYTRCFDNDSDTDDINARNEELISAYTGKGYTIVDRNDVVRLNPAWLATIADALRDSGVSIDAEGIHTERGRRRPMSNQYATGDMKSGLFRRGRGRDRGGRGGRW